MTKSKIAVGGALLAALVLGGCSGGSVTGTPSPATSAAGTSPTSGGAAGGDGPGASMQAADPCTLLTNTEAATIGMMPGRADTLGRTKQCEFDDPAKPHPVTGTVNIGPRLGIDRINTPPDTNQAGVRKLTVDGRRVNYYPNNSGRLCTVNIEVDKNESVTVQATVREANTPEPVCAIAEKMVGFVLPKMPKK